MIYQYIEGSPGSGKTRLIRSRAIQNPDLYIFAFPTINLIEEQYNAFLSDLSANTLHKVTSSESKLSTSIQLENIRIEVERSGVAHAIILTTHETIKRTGLDNFRGWNLCVDEELSTCESGSATIGSCKSWLEARSTISKSDTKGWYYLHIPTNSYSNGDIDNDPSLSKISRMIRLSANVNAVMVNVKNFKNAKTIKWISIWHLSNETHLKSLTISASNYFGGITSAVDNLLGKSGLPKLAKLDSVRIGQPDIEIGYFTDSHTGSTVYWDSSEGRLTIKRICDWLSRSLNSKSFWSANPCVQKLMEHRVEGQMISSSCAGLNEYRSLEKCAFIYSAKSTKGDDVLKTFLGKDSDGIREMREYEDIFQFAYRGAIRDLHYSGKYTIYLYSRDQAEALQERLASCGFTSIRLEPLHAAGVMQVKRSLKPVSNQQQSNDPAKAAIRKLKEKERGRNRRAKGALEDDRPPGVNGRPRKGLKIILENTPPACASIFILIMSNIGFNFWGRFGG